MKKLLHRDKEWRCEAREKVNRGTGDVPRPKPDQEKTKLNFQNVQIVSSEIQAVPWERFTWKRFDNMQMYEYMDSVLI